MSETLTTEVVDGQDVSACRRCGYLLLGLPADGNCPECGEAITASLRSDRLRDADPAWLGRIEKGSSFAATSIAGGFIVNVPIVFGIIGAVGAWMATTADPRRPDSHVCLRWSIRVLLAVGTVLSVPTTIERWQSPSLPPTSPTVVGGLAAACGLGLLIRYLGHLAARLPDAELAEQSRLLAWAVGGGLTAMILLASSGVSMIRSNSSAWAVSAFAIMLVVGLLLLIAFIAGLNVAVRFAKKLRGEANIARQLDAARAAAASRR